MKTHLVRGLIASVLLAPALVLAAPFTFTRDLTVGVQGADVIALQSWLINSGFSIPAGTTGYFGSQTKAAVASWQAAKGIAPAAGYFGPKSRANYANNYMVTNAGSVSNTGTITTSTVPTPPPTLVAPPAPLMQTPSTTVQSSQNTTSVQTIPSTTTTTVTQTQTQTQATPVPAPAPFASGIAYSKAHNGRAIVILQNGSVVAEDYENGFSQNDTHDLESGTKSFNGVILAALVQDGLVSSYDAKVSDVITEWQTAALYPAKKTATLRQLLSLTSGLAPGQVGSPPLYEDAISYAMPTAQVGSFRYGPAPISVFGLYVNRVVQSHGYTDPADYLTKRVLTPAGIHIASWDYITSKEPHLAGGAHMTAREWAAFGEFMRNLGRVNGSSVVSGSLLSELTNPSATYAAYGIGFWRTTDSAAAAIGGTADPSMTVPAHGYFAGGANNQRLYILPDKNVVVARFGESDSSWSDKDFLAALLGS